MSRTAEAPSPVNYRKALNELRTVSSVGKLLRRGYPKVGRIGNDQPVMTLPGFGFGDTSMALIRRRLRRQGFMPYSWELGINRGNVQALLPRATERVLALADQCGGPIKLVGWSLGGYIAREVARDAPEAVSHVVTLGSPITGGPKYTAAASFYQSQGVDLDAIEAAVADRANAPLKVSVTCVYSRNDGVVDWRAARDTTNPLTKNIEVSCSHMAMGFDPDVLDLIPIALSKARVAHG